MPSKCRYARKSAARMPRHVLVFRAEKLILFLKRMSALMAYAYAHEEDERHLLYFKAVDAE